MNKIPEFRHVYALVLAVCVVVPTSLFITGRASARVWQDGRGVNLGTVGSLPSEEKRWALIIGVDNYQRDISPLYGSVNDAKALKGALVKHAGFPEQQVILMTTDASDPDLLPTRGNILDALDRLSRQVSETGLLLFSFSGHGLSLGGDAFLIPSDGRIYQNAGLMRERSIDVLRVKQAIQMTGVRQVLMLLDACRNEPASSKGEAANPLTEAYKKGFSFDTRNREVDAFATIYATSIGDRAFEFFDKETQQYRGFFSYAIVEALRGGAASEKGEVTLGSLIKYVEGTVRQRVYVEKNLRQVPYSVTEGYRNDELVLALARRPSPSAPAAIPTKVSNYRRWLTLLGTEDSATVARESGAELSRDPGNGLALRARTGAYYLLNETEKGRRDAEAAARLLAGAASTDEFEARCYVNLYLGKANEALSDCERSLGLDPRNKWAYYSRAGAHSHKEEYDRAIADFTLAIEVDSAFVTAYKERGNLYSTYKEDYARAITDFTRVIELAPRDSDAYLRRGMAHRYERNFDRAIADYNKALELDPKSAVVYNSRAFAYAHSGERERALADYDKAIELDPKYIYPYLHRGRFYADKEDYDRALADYNKAIELAPKFGEGYAQRGIIYFERKDYDRAIADFTSVIGLSPEYRAAAYNGRAQAYAAKRDYDRALADFDKSIGLNPRDANALFNRGLAHYQKQQYDRAIADFTRVIELYPEYAEAYSNRALAYEAKGDRERAAADRQKLAELKKQQP